MSFAIGNQWQWSNFTLGCDWIGLSIPFYDRVSNESFTTGSSTNGEREDFDEDKEYFSDKVHGQLLRFYLGASF